MARYGTAGYSIGPGPLSQAIKTLIGINVGAFVLSLIVPALTVRLGLMPAMVLREYALWQPLTYMFLHGGIGHLLFNMLALYMFGPECERLLGSRRFLSYYVVCVVGAALAQTFVTAVIYPSPYPTVGASGGIFGLLLLFGMAYPRRQLMLLFPPIPMPAWLFVTLYGLLELYMGVFGSDQGVAHFAHLGGMAAGYLLVRYWRARAQRFR